MPLPPKDPKAAFEEIVRRREAELNAQKVKREAGIASAQEAGKEQRQAFLSEEVAAKQRGVEREEWRQGQHAEHRVEEEVRHKKIIEQAAEEERKKKLAAEQLKRDEQMTLLHTKAVEKRSKEKIEGAKVEEDRRRRDATTYEERSLSNLDADAQRRIEHLQHEADMKKRRIRTDADRTKEVAEEQYKTAKKEAESHSSDALRTAKTDQEKRDVRTEESHEASRALAERRRALFALDETTAQKIFDIDTETKRLIEEVRRDFTGKKQRATRDADRKRTDASAQRQRTEEYFGLKVEKNSNKDSLS